MKKDNIILGFCAFIVILFTINIFVAFVTTDFSSIEVSEKPKEILTYDTKDVSVYVEDVFRKRYSNVFKETQYYIETNGERSHNRIYIDEFLYEKLANSLTKPGYVSFSCKVMNGYLEGRTYNDYVLEIYDISE